MMQAIEEPLATSAITVQRFEALCEQKGVTWEVHWFWRERRKDGRLLLRREDGRAVFSKEYERSTSLWTGSDKYLRCMRTGSPRHLAFQAAVDFLQNN
ncbi:hypothetical protein [Cupriavidus taiwanensis]|uniref:hypothetical protein n=1 Tax=Cupriavidus taiwanensis TaxID=164546 RepID=UPI000E10D414|nr:hypothetical protein [Cupriavidus taiwanensis]SOY48499.1 hypothetical protein CBM2592_A190005 [Cupriavidus taiwanensis]SOY83028.1 hypothetical protein CBM2591_A230006 [Cupriavidus taiwanensis]SOZ56197.1 hypothetical protein CBM2617_A200012 [Cupriavidus taiwanensis]SOZ78797.1 hypothetical protein CBM2618_A180012 [Cupriavidus taiwanensis]SOZ79065.1 hypothetical protein CBM2622_A170011 [Cupriavidus taiwanensis]